MAQEIETRTFFLDPNGIVQSDTAEISPNALAEEPSIHALVGGWPWLTGVPSLLLRAERIFWLECAAAGADLVGVSSECRLVSAEIKAHNQAQRDNEAGNPTLSGRLMAVPQ